MTYPKDFLDPPLLTEDMNIKNEVRKVGNNEFLTRNQSKLTQQENLTVSCFFCAGIRLPYKSLSYLQGTVGRNDLSERLPQPTTDNRGYIRRI